MIEEVSNYTRLIKRMKADKRITPTHVSVFSALFVCWQASGFQNPFSVCRKKLMAFSKVASTATYHKCIRQLDGYGYIRYEPSYHPKKGSRVYWLQDSQSENVPGEQVRNNDFQREAVLCEPVPRKDFYNE